jgi:hypothetical protein
MLASIVEPKPVTARVKVPSPLPDESSEQENLLMNWLLLRNGLM